ncbi:MAG: CHAD domain-containing protein [Gammaproteobacteria bacterium]|nr:CHAD domain-containing protein [Gammaproteobacteria bacterium]MDH4256132.1 CHAD domain-containing protein [Gammaproteobacteria bacterium]MDH5310617.1 CHAD domain-containing protein [Gammaproteobacteria bacterium]
MARSAKAPIPELRPQAGRWEYALDVHEHPGVGSLRIAAEQLDLACRELAVSESPVALRVHEFRKRSKKIRSLSRLIRSGFDGHAEVNKLFGHLARQTSDARDARIVMDLVERYLAETGSAQHVRPVAAWFRGRCETAEQGAERTLAGLRQALADAAADTPHCDSSGVDRATVLVGLRDTLCRARAALTAARANPAATTFHDLRKRCKDHWHHLCLVRPALPTRLKPRTGKFERLCELLGLAQDRAVLIAHLEALPEDLQIDSDTAAALERARREQHELRETIMEQATRLLEIDPDRFSARVGRHWERLASATKDRVRM